MMDIKNRKDVDQTPWYHLYPQSIKAALNSYMLPEIPLYRLLQSSATYYPQSTAMVYEPKNLIVSYLDLCRLCERFAAGLVHSFDLKKGDRVAIFARNYPEVLMATYGTLMAGGAVVACNPILTKDEVTYQLNDSNCKVVVISEDKAPILKEIFSDASTPFEKVIVFNRDDDLKPEFIKNNPLDWEPPFYRFMDVFSDAPFEEPDIDAKTDLSAIIYTSGTTGVPKGVMVSHYNAVSSCILYSSFYTGCFPAIDDGGFLVCKNRKQDLTESWEFPIRYGIDSALAAAPWTHMMGFIAHMHCSTLGALTIFPLPEFDADNFLEMIRKWKISFAGGAPQMMSMLLSRPDIDEHDLSSIRVWTTGGSPCPVAVGTAFEERIGGIITEGYSLTEATMSSTKNLAGKSSKRKWGSIGVPLPFTHVKIVDSLSGTEEMPVGSDGELIHDGPQVSLGYLNKAEESAEVFKDGWVYTGDIARMDEEGFFYITGRKKDIIIYKGYNIAPRMLEEVLYEHPAVRECAVVGQKDEKAGEIPVAFVVLKEGAIATPNDIMEFVNHKVAGYKKIRKVILAHDIPMTGTGKVRKDELRKRLQR